jgi:hypothetical protein
MKPVTIFNNWVLTKIITYLQTREGVHVQHTEYTDEGARTVFNDSFGFTYEINIRTIGRTQNFNSDKFENKSFFLEKV